MTTDKATDNTTPTPLDEPSAHRAALEAAVVAAAAEVERVREENAELAEEFRRKPRGDKRVVLRRATDSLARAKDGLDAAKAALSVFDKTGSVHGLIAADGRVTGTIALAAKPGWSQKDREAAIEAALEKALFAAAEELAVVLATEPVKYTKERPGRDTEGLLVLEVAGRVEGDRLVPAVSRAAKQMKVR